MTELEFQYFHIDTNWKHPVLTITQSCLDCEEMSRQLQQDLLTVVDEIGLSHVILDFQKVISLYTIVLKALLTLQQRVALSSGRVVLCGMAPHVEDIFQICGLVSSPSKPSPSLFDVEPDVPASIAFLDQLPPLQEPE